MSNFQDVERKYELRDPVTPYVCSTPDDFQEERDWLVDFVFPKLADLCCSRGTYFSPVDVRWSAEDQQSQEGHLLHSMLELISRSTPYFLCLLGECYGPYIDDSQPASSTEVSGGAGGSDSGEVKADAKDWLELNLRMASECGHPWVMQDGHQSCSIPELEIIAATFRGDCTQCTFYFRQAEHLDVKLQGVSSEEHTELCTKYLPDSEHAGLKIQGLKQTIVKRGLPVRYFKSPEELGQLVIEDWTSILDTVCPPLVDNGQFLDTAHYQQWIAHEALLKRLRSDFVLSEEADSLMESLTKFAVSAIDEQPKEAEKTEEMDSSHRSAVNIFRQKPPPPPSLQTLMLLTGDRGVGKSVLLAHWLQELAEENPGIFLLYHFIGASTGDNDIATFLRRCVRDLRRHFLLTEVTGYADLDDSSSWWSEEDSDTPWDFLTLCQAFVAALGLGPCILVLDGINDLSSTLGMSQQDVKEFQWLPIPLPRHCRLIMSTSRADLTYRSLSQRGDVVVETLPCLKDQTSRLPHLKTVLKPHVIPFFESRKKMITDLRVLTSPLAVCTMASELNTHDVYNQLEEFVDEHCETNSLRAFWTHCLQQWITQHSWTKDDDASIVSKDDGLFDYSGWVADALCLLMGSRGGLRQDEVLQLLRRCGYVGSLEVTELHWLRLRLRAGGLLWDTADGRIRFGHQHMQDIAEYTLLRAVSSASGDITTTNQAPHQNSKRKVHMQLAAFFAQKPMSWRQAQELPWQLLMAGDHKELLSYVTHNRVVQLFLAKSSQYPDASRDLRYYWSVLEKQGYEPGPYYLRLLKTLGLYTLPSTVAQMDKPTPETAVQSWLMDNPGIVVSEEKDESRSETSSRKSNLLPAAGQTPSTQTDTLTAAPDQRDAASKPPISSLAVPSEVPQPVPGRGKHRATPFYSARARGIRSRSLSPGEAAKEGAESQQQQQAWAQKTSSFASPTARFGGVEAASPRTQESDGSSGAQDRRPFSSPCSYRLPGKREATTSEELPPPSKTNHHARFLPPRGKKAARKINSAPHGRRSNLSASFAAKSSKRLPSPNRVTTDSGLKQRTKPGLDQRQGQAEAFRRPVSAAAGLRVKVVLQEEPRVKGQGVGEGQGRTAAFRPMSAPQPRAQSLSSPPKRGVSILATAFLVSTDTFLEIPDVLDDLDPDEQKEVIANLSWAVGKFLQGLGHVQDARTTFTALLAFLHASYPLPLSSQLLLVRLLERLGSLCLDQGDVDGANMHLHHALRVTFDLDAMEEDMCDHRQVDTFKGVLLGHHGYLKLQEGDVLEGGELLKEGTESISHLTGNHVLRAALLFHLGIFRGQLGELTRSEASLRQCLALRQQWHGQVHAEVGEALLALAKVVHTIYRNKHTDQRQEVESLYRKALAVSERCLGSSHLQVADILAQLGELVAEEEGKMAKVEARRLLQRSLDIRTTALGSDDASTKAARASVRRVELSLQLDGAESPSARPEHLQHIALMPQRDMRLPHMGGAGGGARMRGVTSRSTTGGDGALDIRSVSREKVLQHNRPDSILSLMSASERLLAARSLSSSAKGGRGGSRALSATSSAVGGRATSVSVAYSSKTAPVEVRVDLDEETVGEDVGLGGVVQPAGSSTPRAGREHPRTVVLDLDMVTDDNDDAPGGKEQQMKEISAEDPDRQDTPHLDTFAVHLEDGTIIIGDQPPPPPPGDRRNKAAGGGKRVRVRPHSTPHHLFHHYASIASNGGVLPPASSFSSSSLVNGRGGGVVVVGGGGGMGASPPPRASSQGQMYGQGHGQGQGRRSWSARTTASSSVGSHVSRCVLPGPHDAQRGSDTYALSGPHSGISSLLGPPPCPRDGVHQAVHHRSAWYHVPGRYSTPVHSYPPRRCQKTEGTRILDSVMAIKMMRASRNISPPGGYRPTSAAPRAVGVNPQDVTMLVRQTGINRPESQGGILLASAARASPNGGDMVVGPFSADGSEAAVGGPAVKFREPITVS